MPACLAAYIICCFQVQVLWNLVHLRGLACVGRRDTGSNIEPSRLDRGYGLSGLEGMRRERVMDSLHLPAKSVYLPRNLVNIITTFHASKMQHRVCWVGNGAFLIHDMLIAAPAHLSSARAACRMREAAHKRHEVSPT